MLLIDCLLCGGGAVLCVGLGLRLCASLRALVWVGKEVVPISVHIESCLFLSDSCSAWNCAVFNVRQESSSGGEFIRQVA